jgi:hypothetical protein
LAKHNSNLEIDYIPSPMYERQGDEYIIDVVCSPTKTTEMDKQYLKQYTDAEIKKLHYCRSYLQVQRISDLCTADGLPSIAKGKRSIRQSASRLEEIKQETPSETTWTIWRTFLHTICNKEEESMTYTADRALEPEQKHNLGAIITKYWAGIPYIGKNYQQHRQVLQDKIMKTMTRRR